MKVFCVYPDDYGYDDFNGIVVVAENKDKALALVESGHYGWSYFKVQQGEIHIDEVDLSTEQIVLESFFCRIKIRFQDIRKE